MITECDEYNYIWATGFNCKGDFTRQLQEIEAKSKKIMTMEIGTKLFYTKKLASTP